MSTIYVSLSRDSISAVDGCDTEAAHDAIRAAVDTAVEDAWPDAAVIVDYLDPGSDDQRHGAYVEEDSEDESDEDCPPSERVLEVVNEAIDQAIGDPDWEDPVRDDVLTDGIAVELTEADAARLGVERMVGLGYQAGGIRVDYAYADGRSAVVHDEPGEPEAMERSVAAANRDAVAYALQMVKVGVERDADADAEDEAEAA